jgi:hypothetical protein
MPTQLIRMTLHEGDPEGLRSATVAGRTTTVIACPWRRLDQLKQRPEAKRPAVYMLSGTPSEPAPSPFEHALYIGECDALTERFAGKHHKADAAEWSQIFLATASEGTFNKAHARLAEDLLVRRAAEANRSFLLNGPTSPVTLDDGDIAFAQEFVLNVALLIQTLGLPVFRPSASKMAASNDPSVARGDVLPKFGFSYTSEKIPAQMVVDGTDFVILAGSSARKKDGTLSPSMLQRRQEARASGILKPSAQSGYEVFTRDYPTKSTSMAGTMVYGSSCAGPIAWTHEETGQTYKDWLLAQTSTNGA